MITFTYFKQTNPILINDGQSVQKLSFRLMLMLIIITCSLTVKAQSLLNQDFNFSGSLTANGWVGHSGVGTNPVATTSGLSYTGYSSSGLGNAALLDSLGGEDVNITFTNQNTNGQSIYYSCMVRVTNVSNSKSGDYFLHSGNPGGASWTTFAARVFARVVSGNVNFGLSNTSTATYGTTNFAKNTTYLLVVKYTINTGGSDASSLWVLPSGLPASEGAAGTPEVTNTTTAGTDAISAIGLRQGSNSTQPRTVVDGIHVGTNWASVIPIPVLGITGIANHSTLCVGTPGTTLLYTVNNTGFAAATGINVTSDNTQFVVSDIPASIPANGSATFKVTFTPTAGGTQGAIITVSSSTSGSNSPTITLSGIGTASVSPDVSTLAAAGITSNSADINGSITTLGVCPSTTERGFVYSLTSTNSDPFVSGTGVTKQAVAGLATGVYGYSLTNLQSSTNYSYKAYIYDNTTYTYGAVTTVTTDAPPSSIITTNGSLSALTTVYGTPSTTTSFTVSGSNLTDDITIEVPLGFELSSGGTFGNSITLFQTGGTVNTTTIDVRLSEATPVGIYSGDITLLSSGSNNPLVATVASNVTPKELTVTSALANDKVYDGTTAATISGTLSGIINSDNVLIIGTGFFADANVNAGPPIAVTSTSSLGGVNAGNYSLTQPTGLSANITKASQTITFNALPAKTYGNAPFALIGTSSSGLPVTYSSGTLAVATIVGSTVTITGGGSSVITASQIGDGNYFPAIDVDQTLTVNKAVQFINFGALSTKLISDAPFTLHATTTAGLTVSFASSNGAIATVVDSTVTITGLGTDTITASQAGNANYLAATNVIQPFSVINPPILAWQLNGRPGNDILLNATTNDGRLNTSTLARSFVAASALANTYSSVTYPVAPNNTRAIAINSGYGQQFTINAKPGYAVSLSTLNARFRRSSTGPNAFVWQFSLNGTTFTDIGSDISYTSTATNGDAQAQIDLSSIAALQNVGTATSIVFRLVGWGATGAAGTFALGRSLTTGSADYSLNIGGTIVIVPSIYTSSIAGSPFCVAAAQDVPVDVPFTSSGTTFTGTNIFTAQLSSSTGSFATPLNIGSITSSSTSGTINALLPGGLPSGSAYRIRVVSDDPTIIGTDNGTNLVVNAVTNSLSLAHSVTQPLCFGDANGAIDLTVQGGQSPFSYNWSTNATTEDISGIIAGVYTVVVTDQLGCTKEDTTHVDQPAEIQISTVPTDATCAGASDGSIDMTVVGGVGPYIYSWSSGDFTEDITNQPANVYFVNITDAHGCQSGSLDFINEPAPLVITMFTPANGTAGTAVTITGSGLTPVTNVMFNTTSATFIVVNDGEIDATVSPGTTSGPITLTALPGCTIVSNTNFTINGGVVLNIKAFIEGLYAGGAAMRSPLYNSDNNYPDPTISDTLLIELYDATDPTILVDGSQVLLHVDGTCSLTLPNALLNGNYYLVIKSRNTIETWSKLPVTIGSNTNYDFTAPDTP